MASGHEITHELGPRACVVRLTGDLDMAVVPDLRSNLVSVLDAGCANLVLDLTEVVYADSSALGLLVWLDHRLRPAGGRLVLAGANRDVSRILEISGLVSVAASISTSTSLAAALEGLELEDVDAEPLWEREFTIHADVNLLSAAREEVCATLEPLGLPDSAVFDVKVALGEALANAIRHGAPEEGEALVKVRVLAYGDRVVFEVMDNGRYFDGVPQGSDDLYASSGRGVMFIRALMDRVDYDESAYGGTLVRMTKHRAGAH